MYMYADTCIDKNGHKVNPYFSLTPPPLTQLTFLSIWAKIKNINQYIKDFKKEGTNQENLDFRIDFPLK